MYKYLFLVRSYFFSFSVPAPSVLFPFSILCLSGSQIPASYLVSNFLSNFQFFGTSKSPFIIIVPDMPAPVPVVKGDVQGQEQDKKQGI